MPPNLFRIVRIAPRLLRMVRLMKRFKGVRDLLLTLVVSFPAFLNVRGRGHAQRAQLPSPSVRGSELITSAPTDGGAPRAWRRWAGCSRW